MTQLLTKDGGRRVRSVILDGFFGWYVESRGKNGWNFDAHCTSLDEVAKHIDLSTLTLD